MLWVAGGNPRPPALSDNPAAPPPPISPKMTGICTLKFLSAPFKKWNLKGSFFVGLWKIRAKGPNFFGFFKEKIKTPN